MTPRAASNSRQRNHVVRSTRLTLAAAAAAFACLVAAPVANATLSVIPGANGTVNAISNPDSNGTTYLGGSFTAFDAYSTGAMAIVDPSTAAVNTAFPKIEGNLSASVADGSGGWYIGGTLTKVGSTTVTKLAHVNSDGTVDTSWKPAVTGSDILALAISGDTVYIGGTFSSLGGSTRNNLAAVGTDGTLRSWNPNMGSTVNSIAITGDTVIIGGTFTTVNSSTTRNRLAAVSISATGNGSSGSCITSYAASCILNWNPNANAEVKAVAVSGDAVVIGGSFTTLSGSTRNDVGAVSISSTGNGATSPADQSCLTAYTNTCLRAFNPSMNGAVNGIAVKDSVAYMVGAFFTVNVGATTASRSYAAAYSLDSTNCLAAYTNATCMQSWNPYLGASSNSVGISGSTVYVGGTFSTINGGANSDTSTSRAYVGAFTGTGTCLTAYTASSCMLSWNPLVTQSVLTITASGSSLLLGGTFNVTGGTARNKAAAIGVDGTLKSWNPDIRGSSIKAIVVSDTTVYLGGSIYRVGSTSRSMAAAVGTDGVISSWNPGPNNSVNALAVSGSTVFMGGTFTTVGAVSHPYVAAVLTSATTAALAWNPKLSADVNALAISGTNIYLGGTFTTVNTSNTRNRAASFSISATGNGSSGSCLTAYVEASCMNSWNPAVSNTVNAIAANGSAVLLGGTFTGANSVGSSTRSYAAAVDPSTASVLSWDPAPNAAVTGIAVTGSTAYLVGAFANIGGTVRAAGATLAIDSTCLSSYSKASCLGGWNPTFTGSVSLSAIAFSSLGPVLGGSINAVDNVARSGFAMPRWTGTVSLDTTTASVDKGGVIKGSGSGYTGGAGYDTLPTFAWQRCTALDDASTCSDISGEAGSSGAWWGTRNGDIGRQVRLRTGYDISGGTANNYSALSGLIKPTIGTAPSINLGLVGGVPKVGTKIHSTFGSWNGYIGGVTTMKFQWQRCSTSLAASCTTNVGTNAQWYTPTADDVGNYLRVSVTMTTRGQALTQVSGTVGVTVSNLLGRRAVSAVKARGGHKAKRAPRHMAKAKVASRSTRH